MQKGFKNYSALLVKTQCLLDEGYRYADKDVQLDLILSSFEEKISNGEEVAVVTFEEPKTFLLTTK